ncbi:hypothetical protein M3Y96_00280900 [Aphelenchoides besseyi]|nr:hypothetical protein M3Y96_00280900 [Aphelenchoides besseyi]
MVVTKHAIEEELEKAKLASGASKRAADANKEAAQLWSQLDIDKLILALTEEREATKRERDQWTSKMKSVEVEGKRKFDHLMTQHEELIVERDTLVGRVKRRDADLQTAKQHVEAVKSDNKNLHECIESLERQNADLKRQNADTLQALTSARSNCEDLKFRLRDAQTRLNEVIEQHEIKMKEAKCQREVEIQRLLEEQLAITDRDKQAYEDALRSCRDEISELQRNQKEYENLRKNYKKMSAMLLSSVPSPGRLTNVNIANQYLQDACGSSYNSELENRYTRRRSASSNRVSRPPFTSRF